MGKKKKPVSHKKAASHANQHQNVKKNMSAVQKAPIKELKKPQELSASVQEEPVVPEAAIPEAVLPEAAIPEAAIPEEALPEEALPEEAVCAAAVQRDDFLTAFLKKINWEQLVFRLFAAYFFALSILGQASAYRFDNAGFVTEISATGLVLLTLGICTALSLLTLIKRMREIGAYALLLSAFVYAAQLLCGYDAEYPAMGIILAVVLIMVYLQKRNMFERIPKLAAGRHIVLLAVAAGAVLIAVSVVRIIEYKCFAAWENGFGVYAQMYEYLRDTLVPYTTCENGELMSHFSVSISPAIYLLLPFYAICPCPQTLFVLQLLIILSGVIPLWLICRGHKLPDIASLCAALIYIFSPMLTGAALSDFHETLFLPPLMLWMLYFFEKRRTLPMYIFMGLIWSVGEDAPLYTICIALYMILACKQRSAGMIVLLSSVGYMFIAQVVLGWMGEASAQYRFENLTGEADGGLFGVLITLLGNPALLIKECFEPEKIICFLGMLAPLAFLPLFPKKLSQLVLVIPLALENLASDDAARYSAGNHYVLGAAALLIYSSVITVSEMRAENRRLPLSAAVCASLLLAFNVWSQKLSCFGYYNNNSERLSAAQQLLESLPENALIEASECFVPQLADCERLYFLSDEDTAAWGDPDFLVIADGDGRHRADFLLEKGYGYYGSIDDLITVYRSPAYASP